MWFPWRRDRLPTPVFLGFPDGSDSKESTCYAGDLGSIPGLRRSPGGGHGNPFQYSYLENLHGQRNLAGCSPWGPKESDMTEWLSTAVKYLVLKTEVISTQKLLDSLSFNSFYLPAHGCLKATGKSTSGCSPKPAGAFTPRFHSHKHPEALYSPCLAAPQLARNYRLGTKSSWPAALRAVFKLSTVFQCVFSSHTLFREECEPASPGTAFTSPAPRVRVSGCGLGSPPWAERQRSGRAPSIPCEAWPQLTPSLRERKAEWPQLCGWIRGLAWCRWRLPRGVMGAGKGLGAWDFTEAGFLGGECDRGGLTLAPWIQNWGRKWDPEEQPGPQTTVL